MTIDDEVVTIEPHYEVHKRLLLSNRYSRLRRELGMDICLMLDMRDAILSSQQVQPDERTALVLPAPHLQATVKMESVDAS